MSIAAPSPSIAEALGHDLGGLVLSHPAAPVLDLDDPDPVHRAALLVVGDEPDGWAPRTEILRRVWGSEETGLAALRVHMSNLRRKLAATGAGDCIVTEPGKGYRIDFGTFTQNAL